MYLVSQAVTLQQTCGQNEKPETGTGTTSLRAAAVTATCPRRTCVFFLISWSRLRNSPAGAVASSISKQHF